MKAAELYDLDFAEWARENAELLRSGRVAEADLEHIAEEIEDMGKRERRSLYTRCVRLIEHLLTWEHQPERRGRSWSQTIYLQRKGIRRLLKENPSLTPHMPEIVAEAYEEAAGSASIVTGLTLNVFPSACPWTIEQLLDDQFLP